MKQRFEWEATASVVLISILCTFVPAGDVTCQNRLLCCCLSLLSERPNAVCCMIWSHFLVFSMVVWAVFLMENWQNSPANWHEDPAWAGRDAEAQRWRLVVDLLFITNQNIVSEQNLLLSEVIGREMLFSISVALCTRLLQLYTNPDPRNDVITVVSSYSLHLPFILQLQALT